MRILNHLDRQSKMALWGIILVLLAALGAIDYLSGPELASSLFYLLPISVASWSLGTTAGRLTGLASALIWEGTNLLAGEQASGPLVIIWNTLIRGGVFLIVASLISEVRTLLVQQVALSRTDSLTGILNHWAFFEAARAELLKIQRYERPLTMVFMDIDNFKTVNDTRGHLAGDALLQRVAKSLQRQLRGTDTVGRMGGDEYALLLPEMNSEAACKVIPRVKSALMNEMSQLNLSVSFSLGVLTCSAPPPDVQNMIHRADQLMYAAKRKGKNCIEYGCYPEKPKLAEPIS